MLTITQRFIKGFEEGLNDGMLDYDYDADHMVRANGSKNCPNCGAPIETDKCPYCGTVFIDFAAMDCDGPFFMKVKKDGKIYILKVAMTSMEIKTEPDYLYNIYDSRVVATLMPTRSLTLDFDILN